MTDPTADAAKLLPCPLSDDQIRHMVDRFLSWRLPKPWHPDNGISYARPNYLHAPADHDWPTGTNLFDYTQAEAMVRFMAEGMPENTRPQPAPQEGEPDFVAIAFEVIEECNKHIARNGFSHDEVRVHESAAPAIQDLLEERLGLTARPKVEDAEVAKIANDLREAGKVLDNGVTKILDAGFFVKAADVLERLAGYLSDMTADFKDQAAKLAEREDKLAQADAVIAGDVSAGELNGPERRKIIRAACKRHAARQQPVKEKL